jgi:hypothetical protein
VYAYMRKSSRLARSLKIGGGSVCRESGRLRGRDPQLAHHAQIGPDRPMLRHLAVGDAPLFVGDL